MTAAMDPHSICSELRAVTVYRSGAVCTRVAVLDATASTHSRLRVLGLPLSLAAHSLRARTSGGEVIVLDVRASFEVELGEDVDLAAERTALDAARQVLARLQRAMERIEHELVELRALQPRFREPPRREPPRPAALGSMLALVELVDARQDALGARRRALQIELDDATQAVRLHERRLAEASSATRTERARVGRAAIVTLSAAAAPGTELLVEYEVAGARWTPSYQLELAPDGRGGRLAMRASLAQRTGEDWQGVALSLSTASLHRFTALPELPALRIGRAQPEPRRAGWRAPPPGLDALFADFDVAMLARPQRVPPPVSRAQASPAPKAARARRELADGAASQTMTRAIPASFGAPPMPPPPAAMPMSPAPMAAPMPQAMRFSAGGAPGRGGGYAQDDALEQEAFDGAAAPQGFAPSADQLDYGSLRMQGPEAGAARGRLVPIVGISVGVHVRVDVVVALVEQAQRAADSVDALPLPRDCFPATAQDRFDYRYDARAPADVPSTGTWVGVTVMDCELELRPRYLCVPAVESQVYRTLELHNRSTHALLPGPVDVVRSGEFLLTAALPAIPPGAEGRRLGLGVEESIKVARNTRYAETTGGIFGGAAVLTHGITIEIDNRMGVPAELEVRERVPVVDGAEKDIEVKEQSVVPPWTAIDTPQDGVLVHGARRWRVTVPARSKSTLDAEFTIRMPADRMLVGGNRRS